MNYTFGLKEYRAFFEEAPDGVFITNSKGDYILVNHCFCELLGYSNDELLQLNAIDTYLDSELDVFPIRLVQAKKNKRLVVERSIKRKDGTAFYAQIHLKTLENGWIKGILRNVPVKKSIAAKLMENEERFHQLTTHIRDIFYIVDLKSSNFIYVSPGYETLWQQPIRDVLRNPTSWIACIHPEDKDRVSKLSIEMLKTGRYEANYRIVRPDGTI